MSAIIQPGPMHIPADGRIVATGGPELAAGLETEGRAAVTADGSDASASASNELFPPLASPATPERP